MTLLNQWRCLFCVHYKGDSKCSAFIDGIPSEIYLGKNKHRKPLKGQINDLVFTPVEMDDEDKIK